MLLLFYSVANITDMFEQQKDLLYRRIDEILAACDAEPGGYGAVMMSSLVGNMVKESPEVRNISQLRIS